MYKFLLALSLVGVLGACEPSMNRESTADSPIVESPPYEPALVCDITQLAGKSPKQVQKILGKPDKAQAEPVRTRPCGQVPCERRTYQNERIEIVFIKHKADWITVNEVAEPLLADAIQALGLPATSPSFQRPDNVIRWSTVHGLAEVSAFSNGSGGISYFYIKCKTE